MSLNSVGYRFATICSSNVNRSMEAHDLFEKNNLNVVSYGTGSEIKIPGLTAKTPLSYKFGTDYELILNDLIDKNKEFFTKREIIPMLQRDMRVKRAPQRFQDERKINDIDVCICFDERVFDLVLEDLQFRGCIDMKPIFVFNLHVQDRPSSAREGARNALHLAELLNKCSCLEREACDVKKRFEDETGIPLLFSLFYI
ncbi:hypothetical protein WA171_004949 [Blastocystis sp. BT1]